MEKKIEPAERREDAYDVLERRKQRTAEAFESRSLIDLVNEESQEKMEQREAIKRAHLLKVKLGIYVESGRQKSAKLTRMRIADAFTQTLAKERLRQLLKTHGIRDVSAHMDWIENAIQGHEQSDALRQKGVRLDIERGKAITGLKEQQWAKWSFEHRQELVDLIGRHRGNLKAAQLSYYQGQRPWALSPKAA